MFMAPPQTQQRNRGRRCQRIGREKERVTEQETEQDTEQVRCRAGLLSVGLVSNNLLAILLCLVLRLLDGWRF